MAAFKSVCIKKPRTIQPQPVILFCCLSQCSLCVYFERSRKGEHSILHTIAFPSLYFSFSLLPFPSHTLNQPSQKLETAKVSRLSWLNTQLQEIAPQPGKRFLVSHLQIIHSHCCYEVLVWVLQQHSQATYSTIFKSLLPNPTLLSGVLQFLVLFIKFQLLEASEEDRTFIIIIF